MAFFVISSCFQCFGVKYLFASCSTDFVLSTWRNSTLSRRMRTPQTHILLINQNIFRDDSFFFLFSFFYLTLQNWSDTLVSCIQIECLYTLKVPHAVNYRHFFLIKKNFLTTNQGSFSWRVRLNQNTVWRALRWIEDGLEDKASRRLSIVSVTRGSIKGAKIEKIAC